MHASKKIIIGGLIFLFVLTGLIFFCLNSYMSSQTEKDVRRIASVHLEGMMGEELNRFEVIKQIFFRQCYASRPLIELTTWIATPSKRRFRSIRFRKI